MRRLELPSALDAILVAVFAASLAFGVWSTQDSSRNGSVSAASTDASARPTSRRRIPTPIPSSPGQIKLELKASRGLSLRYAMVSTAATTITTEGGTAATKNELKSIFQMSSDWLTDGKIRGQVRMVSVEESPPSSSAAQLEGTEFQFVIDRLGVVVESTEPRTDKLPRFDMAFPPEPVGVGSIWRQTYPATQSLPVALLMEHRVAAIENSPEGARVKIVSNIASVEQAHDDKFVAGVWGDREIWFSIDWGATLSDQWKLRLVMQDKIISTVARDPIRLTLELSSSVQCISR